jgi:hypothetical protein
MLPYHFEMMIRHFFIFAVCFAQALISSAAFSADDPLQKYPDVVSVKVQTSGADIFNFDVTVSSPYDTPQRYADAFRAMNKDGAIYGERILLHDHATEQPFTRDMYGVKIPAGLHLIVIQARDQKYGYGGKTVEVVLPGR